RPLAAAYLLSGDPKAAAGLIARIAPTTATQKGSAIQAGDASWQILLRWLQPSPDDPFDLLIAGLSRSAGIAGAEEGIDLLMLARLAERESYPAMAAHCLDTMGYYLGLDDAAFAPSRGVPTRVRASAEALRGEVEKLHQSLADEARADREAARTALGP